MDETKTPMGARRLKQWIDRPLIYKQQIEERLNIVDEFINHFIERDTLRNYLNQVYDIEISRSCKLRKCKCTRFNST